MKGETQRHLVRLRAVTMSMRHRAEDRSTSDQAQDGRVAYELARLPREVVTAVTWFMEEHEISKAELARRMRLTPGRVSQILSGDENLTLRTLATVCAALDARFQVELVGNEKPAAATPSPATPSPAVHEPAPVVS